MGKACIVVLNWNGWRDTIECLESIFSSDYKNFQVIVCDNKSEDRSVEYIKNWAEGSLTFESPLDSPLFSSFSPVVKPLDFVVYSKEKAAIYSRSSTHSAKLIIIQTGENLGYAGGNNVGLHFMLKNLDFDYVWILNNDTVVASDALSKMVELASSDAYQRPIGAYHYDYSSPHKLEVVGGFSIDKYFAVRPTPEIDIEKVDYISGASLFLKRECFQKLGLIPEEYFLMAEDLEYTYFYKAEFQKLYPDITPFLVAGSIWHKESATQGKNKFLQSYYFTRNILYVSSKLSFIKFGLTFFFALLRIPFALLSGRIKIAHGIVIGIFAFLRRDYGIYNNPS